MPLPDFTDFAPFNELREKMGATQLGYFELFDPKVHLTGNERSQLDRSGIQVMAAELHQLLDFTLVYKDSRVWVADQHHYHLSFCKSFPPDDSLRIGTSLQALKEDIAVCPDCLQILQYQGYDALKARKEAHSRRVMEQFSLPEFWQSHRLYPVSAKKNLRKALPKA